MLGQAWFGKARHGEVWWGQARSSKVQRGKARIPASEFSGAGFVSLIDELGKARRGWARRDTVGRGDASLGEVWHGLPRPSFRARDFFCRSQAPCL